MEEYNLLQEIEKQKNQVSNLVDGIDSNGEYANKVLIIREMITELVKHLNS